jgi:hypothetical protein
MTFIITSKCIEIIIFAKNSTQEHFERHITTTTKMWKTMLAWGGCRQNNLQTNLEQSQLNYKVEQ